MAFNANIFRKNYNVKQLKINFLIIYPFVSSLAVNDFVLISIYLKLLSLTLILNHRKCQLLTASEILIIYFYVILFFYNFILILYSRDLFSHEILVFLLHIIVFFIGPIFNNYFLNFVRKI